MLFFFFLWEWEFLLSQGEGGVGIQTQLGICKPHPFDWRTACCDCWCYFCYCWWLKSLLLLLLLFGGGRLYKKNKPYKLRPLYSLIINGRSDWCQLVASLIIKSFIRELFFRIHLSPLWTMSSHLHHTGHPIRLQLGQYITCILVNTVWNKLFGLLQIGTILAIILQPKKGIASISWWASLV